MVYQEHDKTHPYYKKDIKKIMVDAEIKIVKKLTKHHVASTGRGNVNDLLSSHEVWVLSNERVMLSKQ